MNKPLVLASTMGSTQIQSSSPGAGPAWTALDRAEVA